MLNKKTRSSKRISHQGRLHKVLADDQGGDQEAPSELGQIVLVAASDFLDQAVGTQALENVGGLSRREPRDVGAQVRGAKSGDGPLAACKGEEQAEVRVEEQIEAAEGVALNLGAASHLGDGFLAGIGVVDASHEGEVAVVGGVHERSQVAQTVDILA